MLFTGYALQTKIRTLKIEVDSYSSQFENGKAKFEDEDKPTCWEAFEKFQRAEQELATTQTLQCMYNQKVHVVVDGVRMTLAKAIRLVGGAGRAEFKLKRSGLPKSQTIALRRSGHVAGQNLFEGRGGNGYGLNRHKNKKGFSFI